MLASLVTSRLMMAPDLASLALVFFTYSLLGYVMECIVLSIENRQLVTNRGFTRHLPFCIIYGFGALIGFGLLQPFRGNMFMLFAAGAISATIFEYLVAWVQIRLFGDFWWDYNDKRFNYKGILCLESTLGWGVVAIVIIMALHDFVVGLVRMVPGPVRGPAAALLVLAYLTDFIYSARIARRRRMEAQTAEAHTEYEVNKWKQP